MKKYKDETGNRYGRLVVLERTTSSTSGDAMWICQCDCGNKITIKGGTLRQGSANSCGCLHDEKARERMLAIVTKHGESGTRLYMIWRSMRERCYSKSCKSYHNYGGRGITVCDEWRDDFEVFRGWALANGYRDDLTIERRNVNGNYCPENCCWITKAEQGLNTRRCIRVQITDTKTGITMTAKTVSEASRITGTGINTIHRIIRGKHTKETRYLFKAQEETKC